MGKEIKLTLYLTKQLFKNNNKMVLSSWISKWLYVYKTKLRVSRSYPTCSRVGNFANYEKPYHNLNLFAHV